MKKNILNKMTSMTLVLSMVLSLLIPAAGADYAPETGGAGPVDMAYVSDDMASPSPSPSPKPELRAEPTDPETEPPETPDAPEEVTTETPEEGDTAEPSAETGVTEETPGPAEETAPEETPDEAPAETPDAELPEEVPEAPEAPEEAGEAEEIEEPEEPEENAELPYRTLTVRATELPSEDGYRNPTVPVLWSNTLWKQLFGREPESESAEDDLAFGVFPVDSFTDDSLTVGITGFIPETVTAAARCLRYDEAEIHLEVALYLLEIELRNPDGTAYFPEEPLQVTVTDEGLLRAALDGKAFLAYFDETYSGMGLPGDIGVMTDVGVNQDRLAFKENRIMDPIRFRTTDQLDTSVLGSVSFMTENASLRFVLSGQQGEKTLHSETENGTVVSVQGPFSGSISFSASAMAEFPAIPEARAIVSAELSLTDEDGSRCRPETLVTVTLTDPAIGEAVQNGAEPKVWSLSVDGTAELIPDPYFYGSSVIFSAKDVIGYLVTVPDDTEPETEAEEKTGTRTFTATDGVSYEISVSCPADAGVPENAELSVSKLDEGTAEYNEYVQRTAEALDEDVGAFAFAHAFDISLTDPATGEHYQPEQGVAVSIRLLQEEIQPGSEIDVVHFRSAPMAAASAFSTSSTASSDGRRTQGFRRAGEQAEILGSVVSGDVIEFETDGFSVYVVIGHEGGEVKNPRVEFHFIDRYTDEQYENGIVLTDNNGDPVATSSTPYNFPNTKEDGKGYQTTQILKDGDTMELIAEPENLVLELDDGNGGTTKTEKYFYGWYVVNMKSDDSSLNTSTGKYSGTISFMWPSNPEQVHFEQAISITTNDVNGDGKITVSDNDDNTADDNITWNLGGVTGTAALDRDGNAHVYLAPLYEDFYFINFHKGPKEDTAGVANSLMTRKLVVFGSADSVEVRIGNVKCESPDPAHQIFAGWEYYDDIAQDYVIYRTVDFDGNEVNSANHTDGYYISVAKTGERVMSLELFPVFAEARWIYFNGGKSGNGSTYVPAAYRLTNDDRQDGNDGANYYCDNAFFNAHQSSRPGYTFQGWYLFATIDGDSGEISNLDQAQNVSLKYVKNATAYDVTYNTRAIKLVNADGSVNNIGTYYITNGAITKTGADEDKLFSTDGGKLRFYKSLDDMTLCAKWGAQNVRYTVIYWLENANDDDYSIMYFKELEGVGGTQTSAVQTAPNETVERDGQTFKPYEKYKLQFAHLSADQDKEKAGEQSGIQQQTISGDGSTVVNVYYDRNRYTLRFDIGYSSKSNSGSTTDYIAMSEAEATSYTGTVYGFVNGNIIALTSDGNGSWIYVGNVDVRNAYDGYRYLQTNDATGTQYGVAGGNVVELLGSVSYTRADNYYYSVANTPNNGTNGTYYISDNGTLTQITLYRGNNKWYRTRLGWNGNYTYSNEYTGIVYSRSTQNNTSGTAYNGTIYYFDANGNVSTSGTGTKYGSTTAGQYFRLNQANNFVYNGSTAYSGTRYYRVANDDASTAYTLGFVDGTMRTVLRDDQGWYYNTQEQATVTYTGTLYKQQSSSGSTTYYVSGITNSENYNQFLTSNQINCGTTIPVDFVPCGRYTTTSGNTTYTIYYYDLTAKYGETIADRWPDKQPDRPNSYGFIGWIAREDSYYWDNIAPSSLKGNYEAMDEGVIYVGPKNNYIATTAENGITHEFRCRYQQNTRKYVYRVYFWDPELPNTGFPSAPNLEMEVNSKGDPKSRAVAAYAGYTDPVVKLVKGNENGNEVDLPSGSTEGYSAYYVTSVGYNAMIINFYYRPNLHYVSYRYGSGSTSVGDELSIASRPYYYNQSLSSANVNQAEAEANIPAGHSFAGWYDNQGGLGTPFNFNSTMPDGDIILYAVYKPLKYRVMINPNGAEIDHIDHTNVTYASYQQQIPNGAFNRGVIYKSDGQTVERLADSGYRKDQATYMNGTYGETVGEYSLTRLYVPISDAAAEIYNGTIYYYINTQYRSTDGSSLPSDCRNAIYVTSDGTASATDELYRYWQFYHDWTQANLDGGYITGTTVMDYDIWRQIYVSPQKYRAPNTSEHWTFLGWFKNSESVPYNFSDPITEPFTLTAHWRLDGGYKIRYVPRYVMPDGKVVNGAMPTWLDPEADDTTYADGASTQIFKAPTGLTLDGEEIENNEVIFRGWALVAKSGTDGNPVYIPMEKDSSGNITTYYEPSDPYTINAANAASDSCIYLQAIYQYREHSDRRPEIANLTLDANTGFVNTDDSDELPAWEYPGVSGINTADHLTGDGKPTQILFGDIQSNAAVHLYRYATELTEDAQGQPVTDAHQFFEHPNGWFLLGFDESATEGDYAATYAADSVIAITRTDEKTLYAVWEPMVYLTLVNSTGHGAVSFSISAVNNEALEIINVREGMYDRKPLANLETITLADGESLMFAFPKGEEKNITISGTNTLGVGNVLIWDSSVKIGDMTYDTNPGKADVSYSHTPLNGTQHSHRLVHGESKNTKPFSIEETLISNENALTVTFTCREDAYALLLDDNYPEGGIQEYDYSHDDIAPDANGPKTQELPRTSTRVGYEFQGWAYAQNATTPDFSATKPAGNAWTIPDLNATDGFFSTGTTTANETIVRTLYAVWSTRDEAQTVYVYKSVPAPGKQTQAFTFTVKVEGTYKAPNHSDQRISAENTFTLMHGEYAKLLSSNKTGEGWIQTVITLYNADGTRKTDSNGTALPEITVKAQATTAYSNGTFDHTEKITVTETPVQYYVTDLSRLGQVSSANPINLGNSTDTTSVPLNAVSGNSIYWTNTDAGGTVLFTNTRQNYTVTVTKTLVSNTSANVMFSYSASYVDEGVTTDLNDFTVTSGGSYTVPEGIPAGSVLTVTEKTDADNNYDTVWVVNGSTPTDGKTASFTVSSDSTLAFTNTLKSYPVTFKLVDQDGNTTINGMFSLSSSVGTLGSDLYASSTSTNPPAGVFYTSNKFWADTYTLTQTITPTGYIGLNGPVTIKVTGNGIEKSDENVTISGNATDGYVITVINWKTVDITLKAGLLDPLVSQRTFIFTGTYQFRGHTYDLNRNLLGNGDVPATLSLTAISTNDGEVAPNFEPKTVKIPVGATELTLWEDTTQITTAPDTIATTYDTKVKYNSGTLADSSSYSYAAAVEDANNGDIITFYNSKKTTDITVTKTVVAPSTSGSFAFTATLLYGANTIKGYPIFINATPNDPSDDETTDATNGTYTFTLSDGGSRILTVPVGAKLTLQETGVDDEWGTDVSALYTSDSAAYEGSTSYDSATRLFTLNTAPSRALTVNITNSELLVNLVTYSGIAGKESAAAAVTGSEGKWPFAAVTAGTEYAVDEAFANAWKTEKNYRFDTDDAVDALYTFRYASLYDGDTLIEGAAEVTALKIGYSDSGRREWQYQVKEGNDYVFKAVPDGAVLRLYCLREPVSLFFDFNGGTNADQETFAGVPVETLDWQTDPEDREVETYSGAYLDGYILQGWSYEKHALLGKDDTVPDGWVNYLPDGTVTVTRTGDTYTVGSEKTLSYSYDPTNTADATKALFAVWKEGYICQIMDGTNVLYYNAGTAANPVYREAQFSSVGAAYRALDKLYTDAAGTTSYSAKNSAGNDTRIEMLVSKYNLQGGAAATTDLFDWGGDYKLTWTTAPSVMNQNGNKPCEVTRGKVGLCYDIDHCDLTLQNITIDNSGRGSGDGGIFDLKYADSKLTLDAGSTLQNAKASGHGGAVDLQNGQLIMNDGALIHNCDGNTLGGGAVYLHTHTSFIMNGGTITNCKSARGGAVYCSVDSASFTMNGGIIEDCESKTYGGHGGAVDVEDGIFTMNGGIIRNCTAKNNGGAIYIHANDTFIMNGGLITGCSADQHGSVIYTENHVTVTLTGGTITGNTVSDTYRAFYLNGQDCRLYISGNPVIYDNVTDSGQQRNIDISSVTSNNVNNIITVNDALSPDAKIGVYAPSGHDAVGEQFGNYLSSVSTDNFDIFRNDKNIYLVGKDGGNNKLVWGPVICKIVDTDDDDEHVFNTLNAAVAYARTNGNGAAMSATNPVKIEMLVDYVIPSGDAVTLNQTNDNIIITTAPTAATYTGATYLFSATENKISARTSGDSTSTAILARGYSDVASLFTVSGGAKLTMTNITMDGSSVASTQGSTTYAFTGNGGTVNVNAGTLNIQTGATLRNSTAANGGAIYAASGAEINLTAGTINRNSATTAGAGIYLAAGAILNLSGAPYFGGTGTDGSGNLISAAGNFVTKSGYSSKMNGGKNYPTDNKVRQDIYIAETGAESTAETSYEPASIIVTGDLVNAANLYIGDGTIWVWAENQYRYRQTMPFAKMKDGVEFVEKPASGTIPDGKYDAAHLKAFRNAQDDDTTENGTDTYLFGTIEGEKENAGIIYWTGSSGSRKVILRKADNTYNPVSGRTFIVYKGSGTSPYIVKEGNTRTQLGGDSAPAGVTLDPMTSGTSGCIWIGELPYGWYIIEEITPHKYFYVVVTANGISETPLTVTENGTEKMGGYDFRSTAETVAKDLYDNMK
ncbi:MAG: DUF5979 domain-containing protein [Oscillospiraceae bacterium]|nr:DUF5979 domain-containing protein [Oscillospiraceae bacterium]